MLYLNWLSYVVWNFSLHFIVINLGFKTPMILKQSEKNYFIEPIVGQNPPSPQITFGHYRKKWDNEYAIYFNIVHHFSVIILAIDYR